MNKVFLAFSLGVALLSPTYLVAQDHDHRYYDAEHKDYHEWNSNENRAWKRYWTDSHHRAVDWNRASEAQRQAYWNWRHEHPDTVLYPHR